MIAAVATTEILSPATTSHEPRDRPLHRGFEACHHRPRPPPAQPRFHLWLELTSSEFCHLLIALGLQLLTNLMAIRLVWRLLMVTSARSSKPRLLPEMKLTGVARRICREPTAITVRREPQVGR